MMVLDLRSQKRGLLGLGATGGNGMGKGNRALELAAAGLPLTDRQREILGLVSRGLGNKEVARALDITEGTVKQHLVAIYRQLKVNNRTKAAQFDSQFQGGSLFAAAEESSPAGRPAPVHSHFTASLQPVSVVLARLETTEVLVNRLGSAGFVRLQHDLRRLCDEAGHAFGGVVQGVPGGFLVLFGVPLIREDDPERAACCATQVWRRLMQLGGDLGLETLPVRLCVASGEVVTTAEGGKTTVHGELLTSICQWHPEGCRTRGAPCLSPATRQALQRLAARYGPLPGGLLSPAGGESPAEPPDVPLVGREQELAALHARLQSVCHGAGRSLLLLGEAGFGKTRLVTTLRASSHREVRWLSGVCRAAARGMAYHPLAAVLAQLAAPASLPEWFAGLGEPLAAHGRALWAGWQANTVLEGKDEAEATAAWLAELLQREGRPTVLFLDNLQWADPRTRALLPHLAQRLNGGGVWLLGAGRRAELRSLAALPVVDTLSLRGLSRSNSEQLLKSLPWGKVLGKEELARLAKWSGGVPLFAVEAARELALERGSTGKERCKGTPPRIPVALLGLVLERLAAARVDWRVLRAVAASGAASLAELLKRGLYAEAAATEAAIDHLQHVGVLKSEGYGTARSFTFANEVVRSAVWHTLPVGDRV